jgi:hypothetical protein
MHREGAIIFDDLIGKLEVLVRQVRPGGRHRVDRVIEKYDAGAKLSRNALRLSFSLRCVRPWCMRAVISNQAACRTG